MYSAFNSRKRHTVIGEEKRGPRARWIQTHVGCISGATIGYHRVLRWCRPEGHVGFCLALPMTFPLLRASDGDGPRSPTPSRLE